MTKLIMLMLAAAGGFMAAVAATPDDETRRSEAKRAYDDGFAEGAKTVQEAAVRQGFAVWQNPARNDEGPSGFRWASRPSAGRDGSELTDRHRRENSAPSHERARRRSARSAPEVG